MELKDTVSLMTSANYKERFIAEYLQLKIRYNKLLNMLMKWDRQELDFKPDVPRMVYNKQILSMGEYIKTLEYRAKIENIDLTQYKV